MFAKRYIVPLILLAIGALSACGESRPAQRPTPEPQAPEPTTEPLAQSVETATAPETDAADAADAPGDAAAGDAAPAGPLQTSPVIAKSVNAFAVDLWGRLRTKAGNQAISPASITLALTMTHLGARGETATQMSKALRFPDDAEAMHGAAGQLVKSISAPGKRPYTLRVANRLFGEKTFAFEAPFLTATREGFGAELESMDFRGAADPSRQKINGWVAKRTNDRIRDLLPRPAITADTRLVLVNALYFYGAWVDQFNEGATRPEPFHVTASEAPAVATMHRLGTYPFGEAEEVRLLGLPYRGGDLMMTIVLPTDTAGLDAVEQGLTAERLEEWLTATGSSQRVSVALPKFTIDPDASIPLKTHLQALGMPLAFVRTQADFTGMATPEDPADRLSISDVYHKAFVAVDENGTEAAAATAVVMGRLGGMPAPGIEFNADHPFLFIIHTRQDPMVLFIGRVADPR